MRLRIHRSYEWKCTLPLSEIRFGGDNPLTLVSTDVLEYLVAECGREKVWEPVPIFEDPIPEHPRDAKLRQELSEFTQIIGEKLREIADGSNEGEKQ
jgi:hypothetical protein